MQDPTDSPPSSPTRSRFRIVALPMIAAVILVVLGVALLRSPTQPDGPRGTVTVEQHGTQRTLLLDDVPIGGTDCASDATARLAAHLPLLFHPDPNDVLLLGFGTGATAYAATRYPIDRLDAVEANAGILDAASQFAEINHHVLDDPRVTVIDRGPRAFMRHTSQTYDVIIASPPHPVRIGNGALYTVEFFETCAARLNPGGFFTVLVPTADIAFNDVLVILRSLRAAFPSIYIWHTPLGRGEWMIVTAFRPVIDETEGPRPPLYLSYTQLAQRLSAPEPSADLARVCLTSPVDLMGLYIAGPRELDPLLISIYQLNTDRNDSLVKQAVPPNPDTPMDTYAWLLTLRPPTTVFLDLRDFDSERGSEVVQQLGQRWWSSNRVLRGRLYELVGQKNRARAEWHRALDDDPTNEIARDLLGLTERAEAEAHALEPPVASQAALGFIHMARAQEADTEQSRMAELLEAAKLFTAALESNPTSTTAADGLARTNLQLGRLDDTSTNEQFAQLVALLRRTQDSTAEAMDWEWGALGEAAFELEEDDLARQAYGRALELNSSHPKWVEGLIRVETYRGNFSEAIAFAKELTVLAPVPRNFHVWEKQLPAWREQPVHAIVQAEFKPPALPSRKQAP